MYVNGNAINTGHNEVISFDSVVKLRDVYDYCFFSISIHSRHR